MTAVWTLFTLWVALALIASLLSMWLRVSTALTEICVGTLAQLILGTAFGASVLGSDEPWIKFLAGIGAIMLTFLAGAELDPIVFRKKWKEATALGLVGFFFPFLGCAAAAFFVLGWNTSASWLAGVALSTTSVAVVYAVMVEYGLNKTEYGKTVLAACFINDLGTVLALGFIFAPFTLHTLIFAAISIVVFAALPWATPWFNRRFGNRPSEMEIKYLLFFLLALGALAGWADSEAVLPAYIIGMVLAGTVGKDHVLVRRMRAMTFGLMTPFYFIRAGAFVSVPTLVAAPFAFFLMLAAKNGEQVCRRLSRHASIQDAQSGSYVHHPADVDRTHVRYDFIAVRAVARDHNSGSVFDSRRRRDWKRGGSYLDSERFLSAAPFAPRARYRRTTPAGWRGPAANSRCG